MADNSFTFWANMKEAIDVFDDIEYKYKMYDALTEYGLYGIWPEDDGSIESKNLISFVQAMVPSLDKSHNFNKNAAESGAAGGRKQKVSDEQIELAIGAAALKKNGVPTRSEVVAALIELENVKVDTKTISRRYPDDVKKEVALKALQGHRDKINVSQGQDMSQGQNGDKTDVPYVPRDKMGTLGHNGDKINVSGDKTYVPNVFNF